MSSPAFGGTLVTIMLDPAAVHISADRIRSLGSELHIPSTDAEKVLNRESVSPEERFLGAIELSSIAGRALVYERMATREAASCLALVNEIFEAAPPELIQRWLTVLRPFDSSLCIERDFSDYARRSGDRAACERFYAAVSNAVDPRCSRELEAMRSDLMR